MKGITLTDDIHTPLQIATTEETLPIYDEPIKSPSKRAIRNPARLSKLARLYVNPTMREANIVSGDDIMDWIVEQIEDGHTGPLIDFNRNEIDKSRWHYVDLFGEEPRSWLDEFKGQATIPLGQRLHKRLVSRVMAIYFAMGIYNARCKMLADIATT